MDVLLQKARLLAEKNLPVIHHPIEQRIAYVVSHGQSYASNGYAIRTQGIAKALNQQGFEVLCFVRPGRPWELGVDKSSIQPEMHVDGVRYIHSRWVKDQRPVNEVSHLEASVERFLELFRIYRPAVVLAASNHEVALPALIAAKQLGLPFSYEVRGFWEISRASRQVGWGESSQFKEHHDRESYVIRNAVRIYTLNQYMKSELLKRGAAEENIRIIPNSVSEIPADGKKMNQKLRNFFGISKETYVLGYVGAITEYEGLDDVIKALAKIRNHDIHLFIVGGYSPANNIEGSPKEPIVENLIQLAKILNVEERVTFTGRVRPEQLSDYYAAVDCLVIARKALPVCELVSPIKPLEYVIHRKPVIASNVAPLVEFFKQGELGWLYQKGDIDSLANTIIEVKNSTSELIQARLSKAIELVATRYKWETSLQPLFNDLKSSYGADKEVKVRKPKIACIMDDFTYLSYSPEGVFQQLTPECWKQELEVFRPEFLFIESAWRGKDELWGSKVGHKSQEVQGIIQWCNKHNIPTIFWNKEDPVHFETFLNTAKMFDYVFTTDMDCIHRYKAALGHNNVYFLPFACQPRLTNPIEIYKRKNAFCFAGAYYTKYPQRTKDLETFVDVFPKFRPLEIYDRNYGKNDSNYQFPEIYQPYIVGTLPFSEIDRAYKGYRYAINLNSIKQSQTMFARRVYELLGSNTITISNFSQGVRLMFGDLVVTSDNGAAIISRLEMLEAEPDQADKLRLTGLRKVLQEHTYQDRLDYILTKVTNRIHEHLLPVITVISLVSDQKKLDNVLNSFISQKYVRKSLLIVTCDNITPTQVLVAAKEYGITELLSCEQLSDISNITLNTLIKDKSWLAAFSTEDYYGPHYLLDMALATRYTDASVIGKGGYFQKESGNLVKVNTDSVYKPDVPLNVRASIISPDRQCVPVGAWLESIDSQAYIGVSLQAVDIFNYCYNGLTSGVSVSYPFERLKYQVNDAHFDQGIPLSDLIMTAEGIMPIGTPEEAIPSLSPEQLSLLFSTGSSTTSLALTDEGLEVISSLEEGKHEYIYVRTGGDLNVQELMQGQQNSEVMPLHLEMSPGLNLSLVVIFFDINGTRINHSILQANKNCDVQLPEDAVSVRFGLRIYQGGSGTIKKLMLGKRDLSPAKVLGRSGVLLLTNHYPSDDDLYRNGFVHSRVKAYQEHNVAVDVFRLRKDQPISWHEFQNVNVITGSNVALRRMLDSGQYSHVLVHFLDQNMWSILGDFVDVIKVTVWIHGAEIQPWWRREYNYQSKNELDAAKVQSDVRLSFWKSLLAPIHKNLKLIFVSQYFSEEVMEDLGFRLPSIQYDVIHNPVDTDLFTYIEKDTSQRKKILSIRPYASRKYANDLSVAAVLELSKENFFNELEFCFIGDGVLFDETLEPLRKFGNVKIKKGFLSQIEIARIHKDYGVFLCPTRMDAQGVSKDEAMSSGLVVVTNGVTAIPEFVDDTCGVLAPGEDAIAMAQGISEMYKDENVFNEKSSQAAKRARKQVSKLMIIRKEMKIFSMC
ncbi:glycosyltransferase [uncultured Amphritea sp.]|uniref:glycosyltransferase n=1 Tax=uncultured Amphritea sp. TaxID=981605 RepID=UPI002611AB3A|nr:glycosyltransferase [uncultured Amphritea sp.]